MNIKVTASNTDAYVDEAPDAVRVRRPISFSRRRWLRIDRAGQCYSYTMRRDETVTLEPQFAGSE